MTIQWTNQQSAVSIAVPFGIDVHRGLKSTITITIDRNGEIAIDRNGEITIDRNDEITIDRNDEITIDKSGEMCLYY